jgi:Ulp1 family protease
MIIYDANFYTQMAADVAIDLYEPLKADMVFVPINPGLRYHWWLLCILPAEKKVEIWDSGNC